MFAERMTRGYRRESACVFVKGSWQTYCAHALTCIIRGLHLHVSTGSCMSKVWSSCPPCTVELWRKSLRKSFVIHLFERSTVWCSLPIPFDLSSRPFIPPPHFIRSRRPTTLLDPSLVREVFSSVFCLRGAWRVLLSEVYQSFLLFIVLAWHFFTVDFRLF